jgi:hypothetical protein
MSKIESLRTTVSNVVITLTIVGLTFGYDEFEKLTLINGIGLPLITIFANVFAALFTNVASKFTRIHQKRAHKILEDYAPELYAINTSLQWSGKWRLGRIRVILITLHILMILGALIPIMAFLHLRYAN